jgi:hypothetical protein
MLHPAGQVQFGLAGKGLLPALDRLRRSGRAVVQVTRLIERIGIERKTTSEVIASASAMVRGATSPDGFEQGW